MTWLVDLSSSADILKFMGELGKIGCFVGLMDVLYDKVEKIFRIEVVAPLEAQEVARSIIVDFGGKFINHLIGR